jgi:hypothetical protein
MLSADKKGRSGVAKMRAETRGPPERNTNMFVQIQGYPWSRRFEKSLGDVRSQHQPTTACIMSKVAVVDSEGARSRYGTSLGTIPAADTEGS